MQIFSFIFIFLLGKPQPYEVTIHFSSQGSCTHIRFGDRMLWSGYVCSRCKAWKIINTSFPEQGTSVIACTL